MYPPLVLVAVLDIKLFQFLDKVSDVLAIFLVAAYAHGCVKTGYPPHSDITDVKEIYPRLVNVQFLCLQEVQS